MKLETKITLIITDEGVGTEIETPINFNKKEVKQICECMQKAMFREMGRSDLFSRLSKKGTFKKTIEPINKD